MEDHLTMASILILTIVMSATVAAVPTCNINKQNAICSINGTDGDYVLDDDLVTNKGELAFIQLRSCKITQIKPWAFRGLGRLTYLDLSDNKISVLTPQVLMWSTNIRFVNISRNQIAHLDPEFFQPSLQVLDLNENPLKDLKLASFAVVSKLKNLYLANNQLTGTNFDYRTFQANNMMLHFDVSGNNLNGFPHDFFTWAKKLEVLKMDRCSLASASNITTHLRSLKHLTMVSNLITRIENIDVFLSLINLETLDLSQNLIEYIDQNAFTANDKLKSINLRYNQLRTFDENVFRGMPMLGNLDLAHNLIEQVSASAFRETPLRNLNVASNRLTYLPDNFCLELRNSKTQLEKFYFNDNPWQCKCLNDLMREVKKYQMVYNSVKYDGEQPVCVMKKVYNCLRHPSASEIFANLFDSAVENYTRTLNKTG